MPATPSVAPPFRLGNRVNMVQYVYSLLGPRITSTLPLLRVLSPFSVYDALLPPLVLNAPQNIGDSAMGALAWWLVGHGLAFGTDRGGFLGTTSFALKGEDAFGTDTGDFKADGYASWFFNWAFAATSTTIVSGAMAERATFASYVTYSILITALICENL